MRADIDVGPDDAAEPHDHDVGLDAVARHRVAAAAAVGDVVDPADRVHPRPPPSLTILVHALASIGITDRRDWRTSARVASSGSALICARVTGDLSGFPALRSTMTN